MSKPKMFVRDLAAAELHPERGFDVVTHDHGAYWYSDEVFDTKQEAEAFMASNEGPVEWSGERDDADVTGKWQRVDSPTVFSCTLTQEQIDFLRAP